MDKEEYRSPIKERLLPLPGTSLINIMFDNAGTILAWLAIFCASLIQAIMLWQIEITGRIPNPWFSTALSVLLGVYVAYRFHCFPKEVSKYKQGRNGEIVVGRILEGLRPYGYTPINDVPCLSNKDNVFNIDHVLVGPTGVFIVETKTLSKKADQTITYKNRALNHPYGAEALEEARRHAAHLGSILRERLSGIHVWVHPILTLPGWWVDNESTLDPRDDNDEIIVVNPKRIGVYLKDWERKYSDEQIQKIVKVVSSYVFETQDKIDSGK